MEASLVVVVARITVQRQPRKEKGRKMWSQLQYPFLPSFSSHKGSTSIMDAAVSTESARKKGIFLLSQDLLSVIYSYLKPNNLIMMSKINKQFHKCSILRKAIIDMFKSNLNRILRCCGYSALDRVLEKGICVLSGSVVLQAIWGEEWAGSDVDLFCTFGGASEVRRRLKELGYQTEMSYNEDDEPNAYLENQQYLFQRSGSRIHSIEVWTSNDQKTGAWAQNASSQHIRASPGSLQLVVMKEEYPTAEEIAEAFDLDIVMNTYDGKILHMAHDTGYGQHFRPSRSTI